MGVGCGVCDGGVLEGVLLWVRDVRYVMYVVLEGVSLWVRDVGYVMEVWVCGSGRCVIVGVGCDRCVGIMIMSYGGNPWSPLYKLVTPHKTLYSYNLSAFWQTLNFATEIYMCTGGGGAGRRWTLGGNLL